MDLSDVIVEAIPQQYNIVIKLILKMTQKASKKMHFLESKEFWNSTVNQKQDYEREKSTSATSLNLSPHRKIHYKNSCHSW